MNSLRSRVVSVRALCVVSLVFVVFLALPQPSQASETSSTVVLSYTVEHVQTAPIVDGVLDDPAWEDIEAQRLGWEVDRPMSWTQSADFDASFQATWRDGALYIALRVQDDKVVADPMSPDESDHLLVWLAGRASEGVQSYTVPMHAGSSLGESDAPFAVWSIDGRVCELSIETEAMYSDRREMRANLIFVDVDPEQPRQRIGWVPQGAGAIEPQLGSFTFADNLNTDSKLVTSWGKVKTLY